MLPTTFLPRHASVAQSLESVGIALLHNATTASLEALARELGTVRPHRDSSPAGATVISPLRRSSAETATTAFTRDGLPPHTDGSGVARPADLVIGCCVTPPSAGGEILLADGVDVLGVLMHKEPRRVEPLWHNAAFAFGVDRLPHPVFANRANCSAKAGISIRYRDDGALTANSLEAMRALALLRAAIAASVRTHKFAAGDAYIIDNHRYLHGRAAFEGNREFSRILVDAPHLDLGIPQTLERVYSSHAA
jgi:alpha-ketoglutarate-dependent taurine dioxygenase